MRLRPKKGGALKWDSLLEATAEGAPGGASRGVVRVRVRMVWPARRNHHPAAVLVRRHGPAARGADLLGLALHRRDQGPGAGSRPPCMGCSQAVSVQITHGDASGGGGRLMVLSLSSSGPALPNNTTDSVLAGGASLTGHLKAAGHPPACLRRCSPAGTATSRPRSLAAMPSPRPGPWRTTLDTWVWVCTFKVPPSGWHGRRPEAPTMFRRHAKLSKPPRADYFRLTTSLPAERRRRCR